MIYAATLIYYATRYLVPILIAVIGVVVVFQVAPRGSRTAYVAMIVLSVAGYVALSGGFGKVAVSAETERRLNAALEYCREVRVTKYGAVPSWTTRLYRLSDESRLQDVPALVPLVSSNEPEAGSLILLIRSLPAPEPVSHGILVLRDANSGKLIAERPYAHVVVQPKLRSNQTLEAYCGSDGSLDTSAGTSEEHNTIYTRTVMAFLQELMAVQEGK